MTARSSHLAPLFRIAALVALGDLITKETAARLVTNDPGSLEGWLRFAVVHNDAALFGLSLGPYTWQLNLALTLGAMALVVPVSRELAEVDHLAPRALGLILGGALGNFVSLVTSPHGVVDFIAVRLTETWLVLNVADVAAYVGLALMMRTGYLIVAELRRTARVEDRPVLVHPRQPVLHLSSPDREILRPVYMDRHPAGAPDVEPTEPLPRLPFAEPPRPRGDARVLEFPPRVADLPRADEAPAP
ncbi:MAG TPA: signal peptidase II [Gemmatimonadaceae bacterium]